MTNVGQIVASLDSFLEVDSHGERSGLRVSGPAEIRKIAGAVDLSFGAISRAAEEGCSLLLTHHDAWASTDADLAANKYQAIRDRRMALYVSHDPLDSHPIVGTAASLTAEAGWDVTGTFQNGLGVIARPHRQTPVSALAEDLARSLGARVRVPVDTGEPADAIGIITGWGARPEWIAAARSLGATTFLSGEALHFGVLYARESRTNLLLGGHYWTELPGIRALLSWVQDQTGLETVLLVENRESPYD